MNSLCIFLLQNKNCIVIFKRYVAKRRYLTPTGIVFINSQGFSHTHSPTIMSMDTTNPISHTFSLLVAVTLTFRLILYSRYEETP